MPCTGTPEPFGLTPFQVVDIIKNIHNSANLIGMDIVEVSVKNDDYREGTLADPDNISGCYAENLVM